MNKMTSESDIRDALGLDASGRGRTAVKKPFYKRRWVWVTAGVAVGLFLLMNMMGGGEQPVQYRTQAAKEGPLVVQVTATGSLEPVNKVEVGAEVSGRIVAIEVDYNDPVTVGQVLARIDTTELEAQRTQALARLQAAEAQVQTAKATLTEARNRKDRAEELIQRNAISQATLDEAVAGHTRAVAGLEAANADVAVAKAQLAAVESNIEKAIVRSPIDGVVLERKIELGQTVAASFQTPVLFTLASDLRQLELHAAIDEADIGQVQEQQPATFVVDAFPSRTFNATLAKLYNAPTNNQGVITYPAILSVGNEDGLLKPGMTASAQITVRTVEKALLVPSGALRFVPPEIFAAERAAAAESGATPDNANTDSTKGRVFTMGPDGQPVAHEVTVGVSDGTWTEITSGDITPGMEVMVDILRMQSGG